MERFNNINSTDNLTGDELNQYLENTLLSGSEDKMKEKAYIQYMKHIEYMREYRVKNKDKIKNYMADLYSNNPEYKKKLSQRFADSYYPKRYGMTKEEYLKLKEQKQKVILDNFLQQKNQNQNQNKKSRLLSYEQFVNKHDQKIISCN